ncbi:MAG: S8 family peptidase [Chlorobi bacterium]|nr:S8 family peptidase [Chlorobiota bacterium]
MVARTIVIALVAGLSAIAGEPSWLYVRLSPGALPLVQSATIELGEGATIERSLLRPDQTLAWQQQNGKAPSISAAQAQAIARAEEPLLRTVLVRYSGPLPAEKFCAYLMAQHPLVEYAEPVRRQRLFVTPNDPLFPQQTYLQAIEAPAAWNVTTGSSNVLIGISDSGVRITHEDLNANIARNTAEIPNNGIDDDGNGYVDDYWGYNITWRNDNTTPDNVLHPTGGHGTNVAGIVAAVQNNGKGISGIAPGCRIVPIKATPNSTEGYILFGYESLIYAAIRGCKVVNCSWGNEDQTPSPIEQSIIAFALARDVAIVAASGNSTGAQPMYPAAYPGVLGVGETEVDGSVVPGTGIGAHCRILAPGSNARTTGNIFDADYTYFSGTSSAAPMVSAVVALVRSRYPHLTALQAIEHVRLSARDVRNVNPDLASLVPGMVNARRALERDPFSTPALVPVGVEYQRVDGTPVERSAVGDTVLVFFRLVNYLGEGTQLQWQLEVLQSWGGQTDAVVVLDAQDSRQRVALGEELTIGPFSLVVTRYAPTLHFLRLSVRGLGRDQTPYEDFALFPFYPTADWVTLRSEGSVLSFGDYGWIGRNTGSGQEYKGEGFSIAQLGSLLYGGGMYLVHYPTERVRSGIEGDGLASDNDFVPSEIHGAGATGYRLLRDTTNRTGEAIGVTVREEFAFVDRATVRIRTALTNRSSSPLSNVAVGYYLDFDLTPTGDSTAVRLLYSFPTACAEIMERMPGDPIVIAVVRSEEPGVQLQCAGLDVIYASIRDFTPERKMESLRRGTALQVGGLGDKSIVVGARFPDTLAPGATRTFEVLILAGRDREQLQQRALTYSSVSENALSAVRVYPQPAEHDMLTVECSALAGDQLTVELVSVDGRKVEHWEFGPAPEAFTLPIASLPPGVYLLRLHTPRTYVHRLVVRAR